MFRSFASRRASAARAGLLALPLVLLAGCVHESTTDSTTTFRYEYYVPALVFLGGIVAAPLGWVARQRSARFGWTLLILGPIAALGFAPSLFGERMIVDGDHFEAHSGAWGTTSQSVKYADMKGLRLTSEVTTGRRGKKKTNYYFECEMKSGPTIKVPMASKIDAAAALPILLQVKLHDIPISNETGEEPG